MAHARDPVVPPTQLRRRYPRTSSKSSCAAWPRSPMIATRMSNRLARCWPRARQQTSGMARKPSNGGNRPDVEHFWRRRVGVIESTVASPAKYHLWLNVDANSGVGIGSSSDSIIV